jgi:hypothetical protein
MKKPRRFIEAIFKLKSLKNLLGLGRHFTPSAISHPSQTSQVFKTYEVNEKTKKVY